MEPVIRTENLSHIYSAGTPFQLTALENVNFEAYEGEFLAIIGHTGSGKSTLIQHLNALIKPSSGAVYLDGHEGLRASCAFCGWAGVPISGISAV